MAAIEDRLQTGVPAAIQSISRAGMRVCVLTGDKEETAVAVAHSAHILTSTTTLIALRGDSPASVQQSMQQALQAFPKASGSTSAAPVALLIEGSALPHALAASQRENFAEAIKKAEAIVCVRTSPLLKAEMVKLLQESSKRVVLAIGDGGNDVCVKLSLLSILI